MTGFQKRLKEIHFLWREHQWLYMITGLIFGILGTIFLVEINNNNDNYELLLSLIPEAIGIFFGVIFVDRIYKYIARKRLLSMVLREANQNLNSITRPSKNRLNPLYEEADTLYKQQVIIPLHKEIILSEKVLEEIMFFTEYHQRFATSKVSFNYLEEALNNDLIISSISVNPEEYSIYECLIELKRGWDNYKTTLRSLTELGLSISDVGRIESRKLRGFEYNNIVNCMAHQRNIVKLTHLLYHFFDSGLTKLDMPALYPLSVITEQNQYDAQLYNFDDTQWSKYFNELNRKTLLEIIYQRD